MAMKIREMFDRIYGFLQHSPFAAPGEIVLDPHHQGIGRHFESVGILLDKAAKDYSRQHPEAPTYA